MNVVVEILSGRCHPGNGGRCRVSTRRCVPCINSLSLAGNVTGYRGREVSGYATYLVFVKFFRVISRVRERERGVGIDVYDRCFGVLCLRPSQQCFSTVLIYFRAACVSD